MGASVSAQGDAIDKVIEKSLDLLSIVSRTIRSSIIVFSDDLEWMWNMYE